MSYYWSFKNYSDWKKKWSKCSNASKTQSPIDIRRDKLEECKSQCNLRLNYKPSKCFVVTSNETITIRYDPGSYAYFNDKVYELMEAKIHIPSMHLVDGEYFDMEVNLYHCLASNTKSGENYVCSDGGIVIAVFVQAGAEYGKSSDFFNQFINQVPIPETSAQTNLEKSIDVSDDWNISSIIPENKSFYTYDGSRPYPPCDEKWKWIVFQEYVNIGKTNYGNLKHNFTDNVRPIVPVYDRIVFHYNQPTLEEYTKTETEKDDTTPVRNIHKTYTQSLNNWMEDNRESIKHFLFTLITIAIVVLALRFTIVMFKSGMFQYYVSKMSGINIGTSSSQQYQYNNNQQAAINQLNQLPMNQQQVMYNSQQQPMNQQPMNQQQVMYNSQQPMNQQLMNQQQVMYNSQQQPMNQVR